MLSLVKLFRLWRLNLNKFLSHNFVQQCAVTHSQQISRSSNEHVSTVLPIPATNTSETDKNFWAWVNCSFCFLLSTCKSCNMVVFNGNGHFYCPRLTLTSYLVILFRRRSYLINNSVCLVPRPYQELLHNISMV